jgi:hypothetical protein
MGSTDPELPRTGSRPQSEFVISLESYWAALVQKGHTVNASEDRGEANAGDAVETPNAAAGPAGSSESTS